jgi:hypothetical protein
LPGVLEFELVAGFRVFCSVELGTDVADFAVGDVTLFFL